MNFANPSKPGLGAAGTGASAGGFACPCPTPEEFNVGFQAPPQKCRNIRTSFVWKGVTPRQARRSRGGVGRSFWVFRARRVTLAPIAVEVVAADEGDKDETPSSTIEQANHQKVVMALEGAS